MTFKQYSLGWNTSSFGAKSSLDVFTADELGPRWLLVCDPASIIHLCPKHSVYLAAADIALKNRQEELVFDDLPVLNSLQSVIDSKIIEIVRFLIEGGQLVFFLRPIFKLIDSAEQVVLDNYQWLDKFRPLNHGERISVHHAMSIADTAESAGSGGLFFQSYLECFAKAEVNGIERQSMNLSYLPLAVMNGNWVIAGYLPIGEAGGGIYFIPPPVTRRQQSAMRSCFERLVQDAVERQLPSTKPLYPENSPVESLRKLSAALSIHKQDAEPKTVSKYESYAKLLDMLLFWTPEQTADHICNLFSASGYSVSRTNSTAQFSVFDGEFGTVLFLCCGDEPDTILKGLSSLARAAISRWANREAEPKGILVATSRNIFRVSSKLRGIDFDPYAFGRKNNISLLTSVELAVLMRRMVDGEIGVDKLCSTILSAGEGSVEAPGFESNLPHGS